MKLNKTLLNKTLSYGRFAEDNSSNHCHFCNSVLYEVYGTAKGETQICPSCFEKYKDDYNWTVEDWRIMGQEFDMKNVVLKHVTDFKKFSDEWNHEHCEFCWKAISEQKSDLHEGYCTLDEQKWVCPTCYEDFKERFKWKLADEPMCRS